MSGEQIVSAREARTRAAEWLERRVGNDWCEDDQAALNAWLAETPAHRVAYLRVNAAWHKADRLAALQVPQPPKAANATPTGFLTILVRLAAVSAMLVVIGIAAIAFVSRSQEQTFATGIGGHKLITLRDGSSIELNTDTVISTDVGAGHRTVKVAKGEVFFQVRHDSSQPFVVLAAGHRITDLGTKFLVRAQSSDLEVALVAGRARLEAAATGIQEHSAVLRPGDVVVATANSMSVAKEPLDQIANALAWRHGMLVFRHVTLGEAAAEFNRYNVRKLIIGDDVAGLKINGTKTSPRSQCVAP